MSKRAIVSVTVAGTNITSTLMPVLTSLSVSDKVGTHADTATLSIDDSNGRIILPQIGAPVSIALGWAGAGVRVVFEGTVDEVKSSGSRGAGRMLTITAKGVDTTAPPKQGQQRHFDNKTIKDVLTDAGKAAGITSVEVDPDLASIRRAYVDMRDESFVHIGERLAREIGGNFRIQGSQAILSKRDSSYTAAVTATWGINLHAWDLAPQLGRTRFSAIRTRWYDTSKAEWKAVETATGLDVDATYADRLPRADEHEANQQNGSDKATTRRDKGGGSVTIEGNTEAIPDGLCIIVGARPGIDGAYRIDSVTHTFSRGGGFVSQLSLKQPEID
ncbi:contractile injection system protein, VgrG/Pvc8 family [Aquibium sp. ELW1220]|uniref:phage late control D family protein n=1 Tax=Aquibium sp. ELW1220 TaxID=2976766 RepID=UPI0025AEF99F|nr:contractile injection system protein, VgrG/Pvc8 family [Aquibium sp. ELW1220]MDN2578956.1 contractile injection system protein, VgrG/Pvc8 family [Aquibium sp. ELW1220]